MALNELSCMSSFYLSSSFRSLYLFHAFSQLTKVFFAGTQKKVLGQALGLQVPNQGTPAARDQLLADIRAKIGLVPMPA
jgi:hypothetical protein